MTDDIFVRYFDDCPSINHTKIVEFIRVDSLMAGYTVVFINSIPRYDMFTRTVLYIYTITPALRFRSASTECREVMRDHFGHQSSDQST